MYLACRGLTQENQENILGAPVWPYQLDLVCHTSEFQSLICGSLAGSTCWLLIDEFQSCKGYELVLASLEFWLKNSG